MWWLIRTVVTNMEALFTGRDDRFPLVDRNFCREENNKEPAARANWKVDRRSEAGMLLTAGRRLSFVTSWREVKMCVRHRNYDVIAAASTRTRVISYATDFSSGAKRSPPILSSDPRTRGKRHWPHPLFQDHTGKNTHWIYGKIWQWHHYFKVL